MKKYDQIMSMIDVNIFKGLLRIDELNVVGFQEEPGEDGGPPPNSQPTAASSPSARPTYQLSAPLTECRKTNHARRSRRRG